MSTDEFDLTISDAFRTPGRRRNNGTAVVAPTVTDDEDAGYEPMSVWVDTVTGYVYTCVDASSGAAVWNAGTVTEAAVRDAGRWEPVVTDPGGGPEIVFDDGDVVMEWVPG